MFTLPIILYLTFWIVASGMLFVIPEFNLGENAASYYSNIIQIISSSITAVLCWRTISIFERNDPMRLVWLLMGMGVFNWCVGEILYAGYIFVHNGTETPYTWYSDIGFLLFHPFVVAGLIVFARAISVPPPVWGIALSVTTLIIALTISFNFSFVNLMQATYDLERITIVAYMLFDPILVATTVLTASLLTGGQLAYPWWFCSIGLILYYMSNVLFNILSAQGTYVSGIWSDLGWPLSFALIGIAPMLVYNMFNNSVE